MKPVQIFRICNNILLYHQYFGDFVMEISFKNKKTEKKLIYPKALLSFYGKWQKG